MHASCIILGMFFFLFTYFLRIYVFTHSFTVILQKKKKLFKNLFNEKKMSEKMQFE